MRRSLWVALCLSALTACDDGSSAAPPDAAMDARAPDAGPDAAVVDATPPDAAPADQGPDQAIADMGGADEGVLDMAAGDMTAPDAMVVGDAGAPDQAVVDAAPDACIPACDGRNCGEDGCGGTCGACDGLCEAGVCALPPEGVLISEILAANGVDDFIEVQNRSRGPVDLGGSFLTDDLTNRDKWAIPPLVLEAGGIVVFPATGADDVEGEVSFRLRSAGETLALVWRDGATILDSYQPFPAQREDISYGVTQVVESVELIAPDAPLRWRIPEGPDGWVEADFDDGAWAEAVPAIGFSAGAAPGEAAELELLSAGRPTSQSSTLAAYGPDRAVNGDLGDFTHTVRDDQDATWQVDLEGARRVDRVVLHNRQGCCGSRLRDITVRVLDDAEAVVWESPLLNPENALGSPGRLEVEPAIEGRFVAVHRTPDLDFSGGAGNADEPTVLSLGEVEVFGSVDPVGGRLNTVIDPTPVVQVRARFVLDDPAALSRLALTMDLDAGAAVWLNGVPAGAIRAPDPVAWDSRATEEAGVESVTLALPLAAARAGENVIAIQVMSADDLDLLLGVRLVAETVVDGDLGYFETPTPGAYNAGLAFSGFVSPVRFGTPPGYVDAPFELSLEADPPEAEIRFTLDGSDPAEGQIYEGPIAIERSTSVRAMATHPDRRPSDAVAGTFIVAGDVALQSAEETLARGFPDMWGGVVPDYGIDSRVVDADPDAFEAALQATPTLAISVDVDDLFAADGIYTNSTRSGVAWERPASVELLPYGDEPGFQVNCGLRIQGGAFRNHNLTKKHSLRLLFKGIYGPTKLEYPVYPAGDAVEHFDTLTLRANSNDGWQWSGAGSRPLYIRDGFGRATRRAMGGLASHGRFAHVFLNGIYWGLYEITERPDAAFASAYFGGAKEDWDALNSGRVVDGDAMAWRMLLDLAAAGVGDDAGYAAYAPEWIDAREYADYMLTNLFVGNTDWPRKNYYLARDRVSGAGFFAFMWDSEWSMGIRSDLNTDRTGVSVGIAQPWAALKQNAEFRVLVGDRAHQHLFGDGALTPEQTIARFDALAAQVEAALVAESARWGDQHNAEPYTVDAHWRVERDRVRAEYLPQRSGVFLGQLRQAGLYPAIDGPVFAPRAGALDVGALLEPEGEGTLYYTLDGRDPREPGGGIAMGALEGPIELAEPGEVEVRARFWADGVWSALEVGRFTVR